MERQLTFAPHGHVLTNAGVWTHDGEWVVYDVRSDPAGAIFDGNRIEAVHIATGEVRILFESRDGAHCGVATCSPVDDRIVFIHGPEHPSADWSYGPSHRRGVVVRFGEPGVAVNLDACDIVPGFTPGALRGGSHVHTFSPDGQRIAFTYEDHLVPGTRWVGVSEPRGPVVVPKTHPRNHDGSHFSVLVTRPDGITRAFEDAWMDSQTIAFQGLLPSGVAEVFVVEMPNDLTRPGDGPLEGTTVQLPMPPGGCVQRRLTFTDGRKHPGVQGPRHWLRPSPDGERIACLMRDDAGIVQLFTVSRRGELSPLTQNDHDIASAFSWSPDGRWIAHVMGDRVCVTDSASGKTRPLTARTEEAPRPEACVFSPDGTSIAFVRNVEGWNQVFVVAVE